MLKLDDAQMAGALFLAEREAALLADEPGFGKTGQAVVACDMVMAQNICVVTTASARVNWLKEFEKFSAVQRSGEAWLASSPPDTPLPDIVVVAWSNVINPTVQRKLRSRKWDVLILDESHYAKALETDVGIKARRMKAVYGGLAPKSKAVWCLTGTPTPNGPHELYSMLRALDPKRLHATPNYRTYIERYCRTKQRYLHGSVREVILGGQNEDDLRRVLDGFMLRRKLPLDVDIRFSTVYVEGDVSNAEDAIDAQAILEAAEAGDTESVEMHLGPLRRETGLLKARGAAALARDALDNGRDKIVLFAWHHAVIDTLHAELSSFDPVRIDGRTPASARETIVNQFQTDPECRVFIAQIQAAGEAITLTAASHCLFVESSFVPKDMQQAVRRIYRRGQTRPCLCQVVTLDGSIDEVLQRIVTRKMSSIRRTMEPMNDQD